MIKIIRQCDPPPKEAEEELEKLTVEELRKIAEEKGIDVKGLRKDDLIEAIENEEEEEED